LQSGFCRERLRANGSPAAKGLDLGKGELRRLSLDRQGHGKSAQAGAPVSRTSQSLSVESLEEALGEGIVSGHPNMPEFRLDPGQVGDLISYLKWLER
jgi:hypothetical protein